MPDASTLKRYALQAWSALENGNVKLAKSYLKTLNHLIDAILSRQEKAAFHIQASKSVDVG